MNTILRLPGVVICQEGSVTHLLLQRTRETPAGPISLSYKEAKFS